MQLFVSKGFGGTTIDDVAAAAGMSRRSVFRYFATKEDIVVGKLDLGAEDMLDILRARPLDEPVWASLERIFDLAGDPKRQQALKLVQRIIFETPALRAVYLERTQSIQEAIAAEIIARASAAGEPHAEDDLALRAITAAAFACMDAAQHAWLASDNGESLTDFINRAMGAVQPRS
jgi:AcrR family transcriptional regulator